MQIIRDGDGEKRGKLSSIKINWLHMKSNRPRQRQHAVPPRDARKRSLTVLLGWLPQSWLYWHRAQRRFNCFSIDVLLAWFTRPQGHKVFIWAPTKAGTQIFLFPSFSISASHARKRRFFSFFSPTNLQALDGIYCVEARSVKNSLRYFHLWKIIKIIQ